MAMWRWSTTVVTSLMLVAAHFAATDAQCGDGYIFTRNGSTLSSYTGPMFDTGGGEVGSATLLVGQPNPGELTFRFGFTNPVPATSTAADALRLTPSFQ